MLRRSRSGRGVGPNGRSGRWPLALAMRKASHSINPRGAALVVTQLGCATDIRTEGGAFRDAHPAGAWGRTRCKP